MLANEGSTQWFHGGQGNSQGRAVGFITQQDVLALEEDLRGASMGHV